VSEEVRELLNKLEKLDDAPILWINKKLYNYPKEIERLQQCIKDDKENADEIISEQAKEIERLKIQVSARETEYERLHSILEELKVKCYETFWIKQNGSYTITETDYKDIEEILDKVGEE